MILAVCFLACLGSPPAIACRFNVRDVGFVDLENQRYKLLLYIDDDTKEPLVNHFWQLANSKLSQTNIDALTVNVDQNPDHPALRYLTADTKTLPALVLLSPSQRAMPIESIKENQEFKELLPKMFEEIIFSPLRKEIAEKTLDTFGIVLIVEGLNDEENQKAIRDTQAAIKTITNQMGSMPKMIAKPPVWLKIDQQQQANEKVFLWSMDIDFDTLTIPHAVVLYGRGRRMGPALGGEDLTEQMLTNLLYVVGADCECGLDRSWMQGDMLPARWDKEQLKKLAEQLGFDPEHPMIKIEMSQITRRGNQSGANPGDLSAINVFGYQEFEIELTPLESDQNGDGNIPPNNQVCNITLSGKEQAWTPDEQVKKITEPKETGKDNFELWNPLYIIGIAGTGILAVSAYFLMLASRKNK